LDGSKISYIKLRTWNIICRISATWCKEGDIYKYKCEFVINNIDLGYILFREYNKAIYVLEWIVDGFSVLYDDNIIEYFNNSFESIL
jgi:hypothetical protein